jgi:hypothetical protein
MTFASFRSRTKRTILVSWLTVLPLAAGAVYACGGTNAAVVPDDDAGTDAAVDVTVPVDSSAEDAGADDVAPAEAAVDAGSCDPGVVDDSAGMFVAPDGADTVSCGTRAAPCLTIQAAIERARGLAEKSVIYVARGTYVEHVVLYAGFRIEGGWAITKKGSADPEWRAVCNNRSTATVVKAPSNATETVLADTLGGSAELSFLAIESKDSASTGESLYGIVARHPTTLLTLTDVVVTVKSGGAGAPGDPGAQGLPGDAGCAGSDAAGGPPPSSGAGADAGAIGQLGFTPASGNPGVNGAAGNAGFPGQNGGCVDCVTCSGIAICTQTPNGSSCGTPGSAGCGGGPGSPGLGGGGGGSSIALYTWDAQVTVVRGALRAGNGGAGGPGGLGGDGGAGGPSARGDAGASCPTACTAGCADTEFKAGDAGGAGTAGGPGSYGGRGGGGAGGWSYAIARGSAAQVTVSSATGLVHGSPGAAGAPNGGPGLAGDKFP